MKSGQKDKLAPMDQRFGNVLNDIHKGMKECGRAKGVKVDIAARILTIDNPLGSVIELDLDSPQSREKATFATRLAPAFYPNQAGQTLVYEAPMEQLGASPRYFDVTMRLAGDKSKTVAGFEVKIACGADPRRKIEEAKGQIVDYMRRMMTGGQLASIVSMSFVVFAEQCLLDPAWKSSEYFNAQGGPGSMVPSKSTNEFMEQCKEQLAQHGMVCATWLFDLSDKAKCLAISAALDDKSLLEASAPQSFVLPFVGEFPMAGRGHIIGSGNTSLVFVATADTIGRAPSSNPSGGSLLQNTRGYKQKPVEKPGEARASVLIERIKGAELKKLNRAQRRDMASRYAGIQSGANMRRIMAMDQESLWSIVEPKAKADDKKKEEENGSAEPTPSNGTLLLISTNIALSDSQSSTACFSSMYKAAFRSASYEDYCLAMDEEMLFYGIHPEAPKKLAAKMMEGCKTPGDKAARYEDFKALVMAPEFEVKIEFPTTQDEATLSSQAANQVYPQSSVDLSIAELRQSMQAMHDVGKRQAKAKGCPFPFDLPKHAQIEQNECMPISEIAQSYYTGDSAMPLVYEGAAPKERALAKQLDQAVSAASLRGGKYVFGESDKEKERQIEAAICAYSHGQALSRCGFEGPSEPKRLQKAIHFLLPDMKRVADLVAPVCEAFYAGLDELSAQAAIARGKDALKKQARLVIKEGARLSVSQRAALDVIFQKLDEAMDAEAAKEYGDDYMRKHFKHVHDKYVKAAYATLESDKLLRLSRLVDKSKQAALAHRSMLNDKVDLSLELFTRLIYASAQSSWIDGALDVALGFGAWESELADRLEQVAQRLVEKLNHLALAAGSISSDNIKGIGKASLNAFRYHGGDYAMAMPASWRSTELIEGESRMVFPAYKNAAMWLLNAGLSLAGAWDPQASKSKANKPVLLICAN